ncbi:WecB/TagA/CpsF family glycosyltransferase [Sphingomonas segetis]|uniref:WecB/TagA/CpsF family glycosyltransferase n=1 Tax=Sphingomonas segetis TaxID=1104779 RepID=UPI0018AD515D|nr:WecB/TagA/CpsF family glycosyltransferase [Sphingomonas segetis]
MGGPVEHVFVGGVKAATLSRAEFTRLIVEDCLERRAAGKTAPPALLFDSNGHGISMAARDPAYAGALKAADAVHADGGWIVLASRLVAGASIPDRSATTDMIHDLAAAGLGHELSHFLLGATEEVNAGCAERLRQLYPGIHIAGRHHGYFTADEEASVIAAIGAVAPDLLWIGLGKPREQLFAVRHRDALRASWAITCGGGFNYVTGHYRRAPRWMQRSHLEWLFRAVTTPKLLWRYATTSPHAIWLAATRIDRRRVPPPPTAKQ